MDNAVSWNSELPSGRNPFWVRDEAFLEIGLRPGEAVSVDTRREPTRGDLVVVELELDDESVRTIRRYFPEGQEVRLVAANPTFPELRIANDEIIVMGVVCARLRYEEQDGGVKVTEEALGEP